jgi:lysophospholipase L1-like esterase
MLFALAACGREPQLLPPLAGDAVILAFGDSLTYGSGVGPEQSYPAVLEQLSGRRVVNAGVPGEMTSGGLERLADTLDEHRPQLLILCLGGNDMLRKQDTAQTAWNLERMVGISRAQGVPVLLLGVPRPAIFGLESAPLYYELAERLQLPLEAEIIPEVLSDNDLKSDQIHPNAAGYRLIAEAVLQQLRRSGALQ